MTTRIQAATVKLFEASRNLWVNHHRAPFLCSYNEACSEEAYDLSMNEMEDAMSKVQEILNSFDRDVHYNCDNGYQLSLDERGMQHVKDVLIEQATTYVEGSLLPQDEKEKLTSMFASLLLSIYLFQEGSTKNAHFVYMDSVDPVYEDRSNLSSHCDLDHWSMYLMEYVLDRWIGEYFG